ncbi:MAG TPA: cobalamin-independent methionine synthase II family protein [Chloroflexota bacterium]|nr:cobalamin-independent methionine synthase II family protein [Chloroflexota bacterium]
MTAPQLPLFPATTVGSWPRPPELLRAQRAKRRGELDDAAFQAIADRAVAELLARQEDVGLDLVTDGEQRRDNFFCFVAEKLDGVRLMTLAEMLDVVEDKAGFERILRALDVPSYAISNAVCVGRIARRRPLAVDELAFARRHTTRPIKVALPGPYLLTRAMYVPSVTSPAYATKEELGDDVVRVLRAEVEELAAAGAAFVQLDEPVLTELVFTQGETRTFMCAALAARKDPTEELELAVELVNRVVDGVDSVRIGLHVCRGNWSPDESTLLRGGYHPLRPYFERMNVRQLVLEYATERAGDLMAFGAKELGLGVVNPRTPTVETPAEIRRAVEAALRYYPAARLFLNPDCGFGTFANRPVNGTDTALAKLRSLVEAARMLRRG